MSSLMEEDVYNAAVSGNLTIFSIKNQEQLLKKTYQNENIVHIAAQYEQLDFIKAALNSFPSIPTCESLICDRNRQGNTPLHIAAEVGDESVIVQLFEFFSTECGDADGSDRVFPWRVMNDDGNTPAHVALLYGNVSVAMYLVEKDGSLACVTNQSKASLLHLAIQYHVSDNYEHQVPETGAQSSSKKVYQSGEDLWPIVDLLLKTESSVTCWADKDGSTPLHRATLLEPAYCIRIIKAMLARYPEAAKIRDERSGQTILHLLTNHQVACYYEQGLELLQVPQVYAVRNSKNYQGDTPLHLAIRNRDTTMVRILLRSSPKLGLKNKSGVSAGSLLQQIQEMRITESPVECRRSLTKEEFEAAKEGNGSFLSEKLASIGMNFLLSQTPDGRSIFHILMEYGWRNNFLENAEKFIGEAILILPSILSLQDCNGDTPAHVIAGNTTWSSMLLDLVYKYMMQVQQEAGGGIHSWPWRVKNVKGDTPLHVAAREGKCKDITDFLNLDEEVAGYVNKRNETPLHLLSYGCWDADQELISRLIGNNVTHHMQDVDGLTPLHISVLACNHTVIRILRYEIPKWSEIADLKGRTVWHFFVSRRLEQNASSSDDFDHKMKTTSNFLIHQDASTLIGHFYNDTFKRLMAHKDNDGNTPLHLAIANRHFGFAQFFIDNCIDRGYSESGYKLVLADENNDGVSSYDLIGSAEHLPDEFENFLYKKGNLLFGHRSLYGVPTTKIEEYANTIGVVAALLATITFTAAFTVPGGLDSSNGTPFLLRKAAFQVFMVADVVALCTSVMVLFFLLWIMTTGHKKESLLLLDVSVFLLQTSFHATLVTFMMGLYITTMPIVPAIAISTCVACTLLIILMHKRLVMLSVVPFFGTIIASGQMVGRSASNQLSSVWSSFKPGTKPNVSE